MHDGDGMTDTMNAMMGGWMLLWALVGVALLVLAVVAAVWLVQRLSPSQSKDTAEVLRRRYAAGEIDRDEYLAMRDDLSER